MSRTLTVLLLGTLLVCTSCTEGTSTEADAVQGATAAGFFNASCPVSGDPVEADGGETSFKGHKIGFCCGKCVAKFDALSDADKVAALAKVGTKLP